MSLLSIIMKQKSLWFTLCHMVHHLYSTLQQQPQTLCEWLDACLHVQAEITGTEVSDQDRQQVASQKVHTQLSAT